MKPFSLIYLKTIAMLILFSLISASGFAQQFYILADLGGGQATGEFDHHKFAFTTDMGVGYETKSHIVAVTAKIKTESYNFNEESDLMVFSLPIGCEIHPRINPKPYFGLSLAPSYPTQWLINRYFFLTSGLNGGISYDFKRLTTFVQYEYLADLTGYNRSDDYLPANEVDKYYLYRYYFTMGFRVRLQND
jgi:hypothetical protein